MSRPHTLVVVSMFKNQAWIIEDWIKHYLREGVTHFYLIDNGSTDDYLRRLKPYRNKYTLIKDPSRPQPDPQSQLLNKHFRALTATTSTWVMVCDIDEYVYARQGHRRITDVLQQLPLHVDLLYLPWKLFGSNGHDRQPSGVIKSFTKRGPLDQWKYSDKWHGKLTWFLGHGKTIIRTGSNQRLEVHVSLPDTTKTTSLVSLLDQGKIYNANGEPLNKETIPSSALNLHLNHYKYMSRQFYEEIKCNIGGGKSGMCKSYTLLHFIQENKGLNKYEDTELQYKVY